MNFTKGSYQADLTILFSIQNFMPYYVFGMSSSNPVNAKVWISNITLKKFNCSKLRKKNLISQKWAFLPIATFFSQVCAFVRKNPDWYYLIFDTQTLYFDIYQIKCQRHKYSQFFVYILLPRSKNQFQNYGFHELLTNQIVSIILDESRLVVGSGEQFISENKHKLCQYLLNQIN